MPDLKYVVLEFFAHEFLIAQSVEQKSHFFSRKFFMSSRLTWGIFGVGNLI